MSTVFGLSSEPEYYPNGLKNLVFDSSWLSGIDFGLLKYCTGLFLMLVIEFEGLSLNSVSKYNVSCAALQ